MARMTTAAAPMEIPAMAPADRDDDDDESSGECFEEGVEVDVDVDVAVPEVVGVLRSRIVLALFRNGSVRAVYIV